jgi:hypothetical protein
LLCAARVFVNFIVSPTSGPLPLIACNPPAVLLVLYSSIYKSEKSIMILSVVLPNLIITVVTAANLHLIWILLHYYGLVLSRHSATAGSLYWSCWSCLSDPGRCCCLRSVLCCTASNAFLDCSCSCPFLLLWVLLPLTEGSDYGISISSRSLMLPYLDTSFTGPVDPPEEVLNGRKILARLLDRYRIENIPYCED